MVVRILEVILLLTKVDELVFKFEVCSLVEFGGFGAGRVDFFDGEAIE